MPDQTTDLVEPFRSALRGGRASEVCDHPATEANELFARALARIAVGRHHDARQDLLAAAPILKDACLLELAYLDIADSQGMSKAASAARKIVESLPSDSPLAARAWHIVGLAEGKLRRTPAALDALLRSASLYREKDDRLATARVYDTIGSLEAGRGRLDNALHFHAISLVDKTLNDDRAGMAVTLGNLGRIHLRAGRLEAALDCFNRDLEISEALGDQRGIARMQEDLGRVYLAMNDYEQAEDYLRRCLATSRDLGDRSLQFFASVDLARLRLAQRDLDDAEKQFAAAAALPSPDKDPYLAALLQALRGDILLARDNADATDILKNAVEALAESSVPDLEIPARISLAKAYANRKLTALAEESLLGGVRLARREGYLRYLPLLNESMATLALVEGALEEKGRSIATEPKSSSPDESSSESNSAYLILEMLGSGAFGDMYRAYDPQRCREVAIKRLHCSRLYDGQKRKRMISSARRELEAASRVRHPGVARVHAIGTEPDNGLYVVQELVPGTPLRRLLSDHKKTDVTEVLSALADMADGLAALHAAGVIHRDLKPENVIVRSDGTPVLVDFGIAAVEHISSAIDEKVAGTLCYMSPEQARGKKVDGRADLYALGVIGFEWLTGTRPLEPRGGSWQDRVRDLNSRETLRLPDFRPDVDEAVILIIASLLEKSPRRRPRQAGEVAQMLRQLA